MVPVADSLAMAQHPLVTAALAGLMILSAGQALAQAAPVPAASPAQEQASLEGLWDLAIDGVAIFRFEIRQAAGGEWSGTWSRPNRFNTDGNVFGNLGGGVKTTPSMTGILFAGAVELSFDDPRPGAVPDIFRFRQIDADTAEMTYVGTDLAPYRMVRAGDGAGFGSWPEGRVYRRAVPGQQAAAGLAGAGAAPSPPPPPAPATVTIGRRVNFLDLAPRPPAPVEGQAADGPTPTTAADPSPSPAAEGTAAPQPPGTVDENFLDGL